ncbi:hypothetical protein LWI28_026103 [Acer negundo]|uniref:Uncharacterized protein n=1 Tax=Acer negundo TaxID=4023 RepID=A0AAD5P6A5_ACENE|nr:hypothetical protein LWI28_026103 [Acer negundo]
MVDPCLAAVLPSLKASSLPHFATADHSTSAISGLKSSLIVTEAGRNINNQPTSPSTQSSLAISSSSSYSSSPTSTFSSWTSSSSLNFGSTPMLYTNSSWTTSSSSNMGSTPMFAPPSSSSNCGSALMPAPSSSPSTSLSSSSVSAINTLLPNFLPPEYIIDDDDDDDDKEEDDDESLPRVSDSGQGSVGGGEKRRRVERGGESCWMSY